MTPYVMCHLKLDLLLQDTGYKTTTQTGRFNVYLTNALEKDETTKYPLLDWLSKEAKQSGRIKSETPIMIVMGNPPYSVSSCNKSEYIDKVMEAYKQNLKEKNIQPLSDDYIKFIRMGETYIEKNNEGVLAYISNNSFIDGIIHRQMRKHLMETFDKIYILDLHGNAKKKETAPDGSKDENVFNIQQGVSINIFVKTAKKQSNELAKVYHAELMGLRENKFDYLNNHELNNVEYTELQPVEPYYFFTPKDFNARSDYNKGFKIDELFKLNKAGITTGRDDLFTDINKEILSSKVQDVFDNNDILTTKYKLKADDSYKLCMTIKTAKYSDECFKKLSYRPFDTRYVYYDTKLLQRARQEAMKHVIEKENVALITNKNGNEIETFNKIFISNLAIDKHYTGAQSYIFPLYLYDEDSNQASFFIKNRKPNLNIDIVNKLKTSLGFTFTAEKEDREGTFAPIDILDYIYGILHSNKYRTKYKEFLKIDFPRIPYPANKDYFFNVAELGKKLREIHLMESPEVKEYITSYGVSGDNEVIKPEYKDNKVYINRTQYFDNVSEVAWNFYIGGYQPAQKWLKDRKGSILSYDEILHYQKIIKALVLTNNITKKN